MVTVDVKRLVSAIEEAERFRLPDMNKGTRYLYDELYKPMAEGKERRLSEIDFERFDPDDIESMRDLYFGTLEGNVIRADSLAYILRDMPPIAAVPAFV